MVFETYGLPDEMALWWRVRKGIFFAICAFMMKKFRTGGEFVAWAQKGWKSGDVKEKMWVQDSHELAIGALEHDLKHW